MSREMGRISLTVLASLLLGINVTNVQLAEDNNDHRAEDDLGEEEASSLHPSRDRVASSLGPSKSSPEPKPCAIAHENGQK